MKPTGVKILSGLTVFKKLDILACDIQNAYLTILSRENIWTFQDQNLEKKKAY